LCDSQAGKEETDCVRKTVHKESSQASVRKEKGFRLVEFQNIPLPSTGGQVTGEILNLLHAMPHMEEAKKIEYRIRTFLSVNICGPKIGLFLMEPVPK
jgi:hypothetical protein